jgi:predicted nucleic acid-binding protein
VILVDANILLYAEDKLSPQHGPARTWWDEQLSGTDPVCLSWMVINAFIRIGPTLASLNIRSHWPRAFPGCKAGWFSPAPV